MSGRFNLLIFVELGVQQSFDGFNRLLRIIALGFYLDRTTLRASQSHNAQNTAAIGSLTISGEGYLGRIFINRLN